MKTLQLIQGSPEWLAARASHRTASEAPAMMGVSKYLSRSDLLKQKATGIVPEVDAFKQRMFDRGHETEAMARELVEAEIGEDLYPVVAEDESGYLLASFDGINMLGNIGFEHKFFNAELAAAVKAKDLPPAYYWQLEQQILVGALGVRFRHRARPRTVEHDGNASLAIESRVGVERHADRRQQLAKHAFAMALQRGDQRPLRR